MNNWRGEKCQLGDTEYSGDFYNYTESFLCYVNRIFFSRIALDSGIFLGIINILRQEFPILEE